MIASRARVPFGAIPAFSRAVSTLSSNPHIKVFKDTSSPSQNILTYLDTNPPSKRLAIGTSTAIPPTPQSFTENKNFMRILNEVIQEYGHEDEDVISQARALAGPGGGFSFASTGASMFRQPPSKRRGESGAGGASGQGGAGGAGVGGFVHLGDRRHPPDYGRIAWPEDILGSVEVDDTGKVVGQLQPSGTYRAVTNEGILGISPFMREKLVQRLTKEEAKEKSS